MKAIVLAVLVPFTALTGMALFEDGLAGFPAAITHSWAAGQIFVDLVIAIGIILVWLYRDARALGRNPWPWIAASLAFGSFGPLLYLLTRPADAGQGLG